MMIARSILSLTGHSPSEDGEETGVIQCHAGRARRDLPTSIAHLMAPGRSAWDVP